MKTLTLYTDGASRGNPGPSASAWLILDGTNILEAESANAGITTNNTAEYNALIHALKAAGKFCDPEQTVLAVFSDSELMIKQLNRKYAVRSESLKPLYTEVLKLAARFGAVSFTHVPRENAYISSCDWMCNQALDSPALRSCSSLTPHDGAPRHILETQKKKQEAPVTPKIVCTPIGIVHSPFKEKGSAPKQGRMTNEQSTIILEKRYLPGLDGLKAGDDIFILCWFDRSDRDILHVRPHGHSQDEKPRGVFATRAPVRPNPISLTLVKLEKIEGAVLTVRGLEALDRTPVLDIKPFYRDTDNP
ncbi:MAG: tRNA (N6-threonylcarbamoyladenosine(37)-N6)-methyltransferase TrmO, partial [Methanocorpusculum sp.]|nr:tRNA (N6-threonylcarbamoyladenosine(37)-N6)-methyltransferase TrmO [Methanocorpusculum sp.]